MKKIRHILILAVNLITLFACTSKEHVNNYSKTECGQLKLSMGVNVILSGNAPASRATIDTKDFLIAIYDAKTGSITQDVNKENAKYTYATMPKIITLYTGDYYILASSHTEIPSAAWETPFYQGKSDMFTIKKAAITEVLDIGCKQQNAKVTVSYTDKLKKELTDYDVTVSNLNNYLLFEKEEARAGYFKPEKLKAVLNGIRHDGEIISAQATLDSVKPGEHRNIQFDVVLSGHLQLSVNINTGVDTIDHNIILPPGDSTIIDPAPAPEEPNEPEEPKAEEVISIVGRGFDIDTPVEFSVGEIQEVIVDIKAENQIYDLWVEIDSPFLTEEELSSLALPIPKKFNLGNLTPALKEAFGPTGLGLIGNDEVRGKSSLVFDISRFTSLLLQAGTHKFIITIGDFDGYELQKTLTLVNH